MVFSKFFFKSSNYYSTRMTYEEISPLVLKNRSRIFYIESLFSYLSGQFLNGLVEFFYRRLMLII